MRSVPEPSLHPPEHPPAPLRCSLCRRIITEALELRGGPVCRQCLRACADLPTMDALSALLCAAIVTDEPDPKEVIP